MDSWARTCEHTLGKKHFVARCVEKDCPSPAPSPSTCEHTLEKNHIVARCVEKYFPFSATWPSTSKHKLEKNVISVSSVEKKFPVQQPGRAHENTLLRKASLLPGVKKTFSYAASLTMNMWMHTEENPYCCSKCGKWIFVAGHMTDLFLRFEVRVEVGDNEIQTCIYLNECRKFFFQGGPTVDFPGVAKKIFTVRVKRGKISF